MTGDDVAIAARSLDDNGEVVRERRYTSMYATLSATRRNQVTAILDDVIAFVRQQLDITA